MPGNDLAVVVPIVNEVGNVQPLIDELHEHLSEYDWEVVFVDDDSSDGTTAALSGMPTTKARIVVLMDGDGQDAIGGKRIQLGAENGDFAARFGRPVKGLTPF